LRIAIKDDTELGLAILVAEFGDGNYRPVGAVVSINEAREIADSDMQAGCATSMRARRRPHRTPHGLGPENWRRLGFANRH
jgi:hypothetical protein